MLARASAASLLAATLVVAAAPTPHARAASDPVARAVSYLIARQQPNGAFFAPAATADVVAEAVAVVSAFGGPPDVVARASHFIAVNGPSRARDRAGHAARIVLGIAASGRDPRSLEGVDFVAALRAHFNAVTGLYDTGLYANALAVLGASAAGIPLADRTYDYFRLNRCANGGLAHEPGCTQAPDVDTTGLTLIALRASGRGLDDVVVAGARAFLLQARNASGAWGLEAGDETNANSTGLALSAVAALGERADSAPWRAGERDPLRALRALQLPSGAFAYIAGQRANDYATVQAVPGLAGVTYPLRGRTQAGASRAAPITATDRTPARTAPQVTLAGSSPAASPEATPDPRVSRQQRAERILGDRTSGSGARAALLWISLLVGASLIVVPPLIRRRRARG